MTLYSIKNIKSSINFVLLLLLSFTNLAQVNKDFPEIEGTTLNDSIVNIPKDTKGKYTLVGMAYSKKAEDDLNTWFEPVYRTFIHKSDKPSLFAVNYDINLYFIPMFTGANKAVAGKATKKMKDGIDKKLQPYVLVFSGKMEDYKSVLNLGQKDVPYFFVLDKNGKIIYATSGKFTEDKLEQIEELIEE
ncbi:MAG: hypothetical protein ACK4ND_00725 [Cytophagaceae bacterium]